MRRITKIILHCSDSDYAHHDNIYAIRHWHVNENGWSDIGYHFVITKNGIIRLGRPLHILGAHCKGHNSNSIGICLTGKEKFSEEQFESLKAVCEDLISRYNLSWDDVKGHNYFDKSRPCPNFNVKTFIKTNKTL